MPCLAAATPCEMAFNADEPWPAIALLAPLSSLDRPLWPPATADLTPDLACEPTLPMPEIASGRTCLMPCAASWPFWVNAWPTFEPSDWMPETAWPPCELTLPDVSPETLEATLALPSAAASLTPPPEPCWPETLLAALLMSPWTLPCVAETAALPWLENCCPDCWASCAEVLTAVRALALAAVSPEVIALVAVEPAEVTRPFAAATAPATRDWAPAIAERTAPDCVFPAPCTARSCLAVACWIT